MPDADADAVTTYRTRYRLEEIRSSYNGWAHLCFTSGVCIAVVACAALQVTRPSMLEWLTVPIVFLYANLVEYFGHRGPMHHPVRGLRLLYQRHTKQHHRFFTDEHMAFETSDDFKAVLFPPVMILFFVGGFGVPMWILLHLLATDNVAWLAVATAVAYYLNYEWLHFAYHCAPGSRVGRIPGIQALRQLHLLHHRPALMMGNNFNITYPIGDFLFRTVHRPPGDSS